MKVVSKVRYVLSPDRYSSDETLGFTRQSLICMIPNAPEDLDPESGKNRLDPTDYKRQKLSRGKVEGGKGKNCLSQSETLPHIDYDVHQIH